VFNTLISGGCIVSVAQVTNSVLFNKVRVHPHCVVDQAVLLPDVEVGAGARVRRAVVDRSCVIPPGMIIGENADDDARRFYRSEGGVVLVTRDMLAGVVA
jgi:glucose-1-phosphate adenylyltransferase